MRVKLTFDLPINDLLRGRQQLDIDIILSAGNYLESEQLVVSSPLFSNSYLVLKNCSFVLPNLLVKAFLRVIRELECKLYGVNNVDQL